MSGTVRGDAIAQTWVANAGAWIQAVRGERLESRRVATDAAILRAVSRQPVQRVLDVGCGEGWLLRALADAGKDVVGIDVSPGLVDAARRAGAGAVHLMSYDAFAADPTCLGRFDGAICNFSLFEENLTPLLAAVCAALHPGGFLFVQTLHPSHAQEGGNARGWREENFEQLADLGFRPTAWFSHPTEAWTAMLADAGLREVHTDTVSHPHSGVALSLLICASKAL